MSRATKIISASSAASKQIREFIKFRQNGGCRQCGKQFNIDDPILTKGRGERRYYHVECAKKLHII